MRVSEGSLPPFRIEEFQAYRSIVTDFPQNLDLGSQIDLSISDHHAVGVGLGARFFAMAGIVDMVMTDFVEGDFPQVFQG